MIYHAKLPTLKDKILDQHEEEVERQLKEERAKERMASIKKGSKLKVKAKK